LKQPGLVALSWVAGLAACTSTGGIIGDPVPGPTDDDDSAALDDDDSAAPDDDDTSPPPFDCGEVADQPASQRVLDGARGYHGLAFDDAGWIYGWSAGAMIRARYDGTSEVFVPGLPRLEQIVRMPDGDLAAANSRDHTLLRVTPGGGTDVITTDLNAYGLVWGPDDRLWAINNEIVTRVDVATGLQDPLGAWDIPFPPHSADFSGDFSRLYTGLIGDGTFGVVDLDATFEQADEPKPFAFDLGNGSRGWHDGVAVDNCGWIYVVDFRSSRLFRIDPDGTSRVYHSWADDQSQYGHGAVWGSGVDGWREDALYLPMPYNNNTVQEIVTGTYARTWEGEVINAPGE